MTALLKFLYPKASSIPRWVIFLIDVSICSFSFVFATFLRFNFFLNDTYQIEYFYGLPVVIAIRVAFMLYFRIYAGIIRHTSVQDALRVSYTVTFSTIVIIAVNYFYSRFMNQGIVLIPISIIIIDYFGSLLIMNTFRISVKILFMRFNKFESGAATHYAIFGAGEAGIIVKRKLQKEGIENRKVVAFFDDDPRKEKNFVDGITIYNGLKDIESVIKKLNIQELIISPQHMPKLRKQELIEKCLSLDVNVRSVPPVERWINGELSFNQLKQVRIEDLIERDAIVLDKGAIAQQLFNKTILVTGAAGSIGSEIANQILKHFNPKKVLLVDKSEVRLYELEAELEQNHRGLHRNMVEIVMGDITNEARMRNVFQTFAPNIVYHAAAYKHVPLMENNPSEAVRVNIGGTKLIADLAVEYGVEKFVMVSTDKAVNPTNVMGASKRIAEIYVQSLNSHLAQKGDVRFTRFITTRFGNVLGSSGSVIPKFRKQIEDGGPITVTHPDITRYFMTIPEACQLVLEAGNMGKGGEIYIFDMGKSIKIIDLAKKMIQLSGLKLGSDIQIVFTGLRPGEKIKEELLADQEKTLPTYHPKIMIAKVRTYDFATCLNDVNALIDLYNDQQNGTIVSKMKALVPEFISQNSIYEELDYERKKQTVNISSSTFLS